MGRGRHAGYDEQREAILARAAHLFASQGYAGTSMLQVADACGLSKATLYHYWRDKDALLFSIAEAHVARLQRLVDDALEDTQAPAARMRALVRRLLDEYAGAQDAHRVLTGEVRFLPSGERGRIEAREREVVAAFAKVVAALRPDLDEAAMAKPLTMLLFGMVNWMFTWLKPDGALDHAALAPVVADLFLGGLGAVKAPDSQRISPSPSARPHPSPPPEGEGATPQGDFA
jgi:AcrR family transcriptional regulator